jgi:hypothetical protein
MPERLSAEEVGKRVERGAILVCAHYYNAML